MAELSKGMKTALQYIMGLSSHAAITILDEPINGLDAAMRKRLYETLLESHAEHPRLIMISTHHIEELQALFESLVVLKNGKLLIHEPMAQIREGASGWPGEKTGWKKPLPAIKCLSEAKWAFFPKLLTW